MEQVLDGIHKVLTHYKALAIAILSVIIAFPVITTSMMWAERIGYFGNVYQQEHAILRNLATEQAQISRDSLHKHDDLRSELIINRGLIQGGNYFQQRTCVNTANNQDERNKCLESPWERR